MGKCVVHLDTLTLREMLQLPEHCQIVAVTPHLTDRSLALLLESAALPEGEEGERYPLANVLYTVERHPESPEFRKITARVEVRFPEKKAPDDLLGRL